MIGRYEIVLKEGYNDYSNYFYNYYCLRINIFGFKLYYDGYDFDFKIFGDVKEMSLEEAERVRDNLIKKEVRKLNKEMVVSYTTVNKNQINITNLI